MPRALPVPLRELVIARIADGVPLADVAGELGLSFWTVRDLWRRYRDGGLAALVPDYANCGRPGLRGSARMHRRACWLRHRHPTWGAGLIRTILVERCPDEAVPNERTLRRWFAAAGLRRPPRPPREPPPAHATTPHGCWQLDAKEQLRLADGTRASWLLAVDEASGATLPPAVFPPRLVADRRSGSGARRAAGGVRRLGAAGGAAG